MRSSDSDATATGSAACAPKVICSEPCVRVVSSPSQRISTSTRLRLPCSCPCCLSEHPFGVLPAPEHDQPIDQPAAALGQQLQILGVGAIALGKNIGEGEQLAIEHQGREQVPRVVRQPGGTGSQAARRGRRWKFPHCDSVNTLRSADKESGVCRTCCAVRAAIPGTHAFLRRWYFAVPACRSPKVWNFPFVAGVCRTLYSRYVPNWDT